MRLPKLVQCDAGLSKALGATRGTVRVPGLPATTALRMKSIPSYYCQASPSRLLPRSSVTGLSYQFAFRQTSSVMIDRVDGCAISR